MPRRSTTFEYVLEGDKKLPKKDQTAFHLLAFSAEIEEDMRMDDVEAAYSQMILLEGSKEETENRAGRRKKKKTKAAPPDQVGILTEQLEEIKKKISALREKNKSILEMVLKGWTNFKINGKPLKFSIDNAYLNLTKDEINELIAACRGLTEEERKNSE